MCSPVNAAHYRTWSTSRWIFSLHSRFPSDPWTFTLPTCEFLLLSTDSVNFFSNSVGNSFPKRLNPKSEREFFLSLSCVYAEESSDNYFYLPTVSHFSPFLVKLTSRPSIAVSSMTTACLYGIGRRLLSTTTNSAIFSKSRLFWEQNNYFLQVI